jgi:hypothetical protein
MATSIALAADPSRLASLLLGYISAVCAFLAPRQPGAPMANIDQLSHWLAPTTARSKLRRVSLAPKVSAGHALFFDGGRSPS